MIRTTAIRRPKAKSFLIADDGCNDVHAFTHFGGCAGSAPAGDVPRPRTTVRDDHLVRRGMQSTDRPHRAPLVGTAFCIEFDGVEISPDNETKILELSPVSNPQAGLAVLCNPQSVMLIVTHGADEYAVIFDGRTVRSVRKNNYEHPPVTGERR